VSHVEWELLILSEDLSSPPMISVVRVARSLVFCVVFCRSLFVLWSLFFWSLCCLSFGHCVVCLLAIVLSVFWPLCCLSFVHCVVCLLSIVLSVLRFMDSDYSFGIFKLFLKRILHISKSIITHRNSCSHFSV